MDPIQNPYRPGAGTKPAILAGRDAEMRMAEILIKRVKNGDPNRSIMYYGLRGVGKTVLLNEVENKAKLIGAMVHHIEISEQSNFKAEIIRCIRKSLLEISAVEKAKSYSMMALRILKGFSISVGEVVDIGFDVDKVAGKADSGNFKSDFTELFEEVGNVVKQEGGVLLFSIDEVQYLDESEFTALIEATHRISQLSLPIAFVCAGLPQVAGLSGEAKSYAERLFDFVPLQNLNTTAANLAITGPAKTKGAEYNGDALDAIVRRTQGYPYFIQEYGRHVWDIAVQSPFTIEDIRSAEAITVTRLDDSFYKVRIDRATNVERDFMHAMALIGRAPYKLADIADRMKRKAESINPHRSSLIRKGFVYSPQHGYLDFTVPMFNEFIIRYYARATK